MCQEMSVNSLGLHLTDLSEGEDKSDNRLQVVKLMNLKYPQVYDKLNFILMQFKTT